MAVVLIGDGEIYEMKEVKRTVEDLGVEASIWDVNRWPGGPPITIDSSNTEVIVEDRLDIEDVSVAYVQYYEFFNPFVKRFREKLNEDFVSTYFSLREHRGFFESLLRMIEHHGGTVLPALDTRAWHDQKPWQLRLFDSLAIPIPDSLTTTDPEEVIEFCERHDQVIHKTIGNGGLPTKIELADLTDDKLEKLATAPVLFQEFVPGDDLRIYVLDGEVVGAFRYESESYSFKMDLREGNADKVTCKPASISETIREDVLKATSAADLEFAAADVRRNGDDYALLEINDTPRFKAADNGVGLDIARKLGEHLASYE